MTRTAGFLLVLLGLGLSSGWGEPVVKNASVTAVSRTGQTWNRMTGTVEAPSELTVDQILAVVQDWEAYPRLFPQVHEVRVERRPNDVLLSEVVIVSALGFSATNRFTLKLETSRDSGSGGTRVSWTQHAADSTIDELQGSWLLTPQTSGKGHSVLVEYSTRSLVKETFPGQAGFVGPFYGGELKKIVKAVLDEAQKRGLR